MRPAPIVLATDAPCTLNTINEQRGSFGAPVVDENNYISLFATGSIRCPLYTTIFTTSLSYHLVFLLYMRALDSVRFTSPIGGPNKKKGGKQTEQFGAP
jgi:hypothetical protein